MKKKSKKIKLTLFVYYCVCTLLILIAADSHIQIGRIHFFLPIVPEIMRCGLKLVSLTAC